MKRVMTMGAMGVALMAMVSCSDNETEIPVQPGGDGDQVALGVSPNLKVAAGTKTTTKAVVDGEAITYEAANYSDADYAPGLGVLVTNSGATGWYVPDGSSYPGHHVWYMGDAAGANWKSILTKGANFAATAESPYYLTSTVGKVYAYYPYDATLTGSLTITQESDLQIPVTILATGTISANTNNAKKYWTGSAWANTLAANKVNLSLAAEKDYLYFDPGTAGRYVNNGRAAGQTPVKPDDEPNNTDATNPGYKINLTMAHALSMLSFRVYDGGNLSSNPVNLTKIRIKNSDSSTANPFKMGNGFMSLVDGTISGVSTNGDIERVITGYTLMRQVDAGGTESGQTFIAAGTGNNQISGKTVSKTVSAIIYPTTFTADDDIEVIISLQEGSNPAVDYPVTLPANSWEANNNYIYTLSAGRNKLTVVDVSVEAWVDNEQDEIPL